MKRRLKQLIQQSLIIQPGDTLIIRMERQISQDHAAQIKAAVAQRLPGVDVLVIGCHELAVYRP